MNETFEDFSSSLKAKFCELRSSSFLISLLISGVLINHKYIMIYYSDIDPHRKLLMLEYLGIYILIPILIALFYVFYYPYIARKFYSRSLEFNNKFKETKVEKLKKRILDEDDEESLVKELEKATNALDKKTQFVAKMERNYLSQIDNLKQSNKTKVDELEFQISDLKMSHEDEIRNLQESNNTNIRNSETEMKKLDSSHTKEVSKLNEEIGQVNSKSTNLISENKKLQEEHEKLKYENQKNIDEVARTNAGVMPLLDIIKNYGKFQSSTIDKKIEQLLLANIPYNHIDYTLALENGYTQKVRPSMKMPVTKTTDEILIKELHRVNEADTNYLLNRLIDVIKNTNHYYLKDKARSVYNLK